MSHKRASGPRERRPSKARDRQVPKQQVLALPKREAMSLLNGITMPMNPSGPVDLFGSGTQPTSPDPGTIPAPNPPADAAPMPSGVPAGATDISQNAAANNVSTDSLNSIGSVEQASGTQEAPVNN